MYRFLLAVTLGLCLVGTTSAADPRLAMLPTARTGSLPGCTQDCGCAGTGACICGQCDCSLAAHKATHKQAAPDPYHEAYRQAMRLHQPLVVWVQTENPAAEACLHDCVHVHLDSFVDLGGPGVVVGVPTEDDQCLIRASDLKQSKASYRAIKAATQRRAEKIETPQAAAPVFIPHWVAQAPRFQAPRFTGGGGACST
jgi:hypothetical protein